MKRQNKKPQPIRSFKEYQKRFFPLSYREGRVPEDPNELGKSMAEEAFEKLRRILNGIK
jgi:hypothetical protein